MAGTPTPNFGLPQYDESDPGALDVLLNGITSQLDTSLKAQLDSVHTTFDPLKADTGWKNITSGFESGVSTGSTPGHLQYRIKGGVVYWRGGVTGAFPPGYTTVLTNFPTAARPADNGGQPVRAGASSSSANPAFVEIYPNGNLVVAHNSGSNRAWVAFATSYPQG